VTLLTPPDDRETLQAFYDRIRPFGRGWRAAVATQPVTGSVSASMLGWVLGCVAVYATLFGTGYLLYGNLLAGVVSLLVAAVAGWGILRILPKVGLI
jgi:exosortase/archaeosortase